MSFQAVVGIPTTVRRWKSYPSYKDSDIEWLGKIPAHWETKAVWILFRLGRGRVISNEEILDNPGPYPVYSSQTENEGIMGYIDTYDFDGNYITWTTDGANAGTVFHRAGKFNCTNVCGTLFAQRSDIDLRYFAHALNLVTSWFVRHDINPKLMNNVMARIRVQVPPAAEQRYIATLLDRETAKIDALVAKKQRLIALLQEKRAALITRAVTRGLPSTDSGQATPNVPMKDSGIEWLGEIPAHWEVKQIRNIAKSLQTGPFGSQLHSGDYTPGGIPVINPSHLRDGCIVPDMDCAVDEATALRLRQHELYEGDIIFARRGEMGRCALVTKVEAGWLCGTGSLRIRPNVEVVYPPFLNRFLSISGIREWLLLEAVGATMDNLNTTILGRMPLLVPPVEEQRAVNTFCDSEASRIDALIAKVREGIEKLKEYRTALVSAAVTGKIDVREDVVVA